MFTASQGVGPVGENGTVLFGLKVLKALKKFEQSKA